MPVFPGVSGYTRRHANGDRKGNGTDTKGGGEMSAIKTIDYSRPYRLWASSIVMTRLINTVFPSIRKNAV